MHTVMTTNVELFRLMSWLSPSFPVGAYAFSHGLESAVLDGLVSDAASAQDWINDIVMFGGGQTDLVFLGEAWEVTEDAERLQRVHTLALAFQSTAEIRLESTAQAAAFLKTVTSTWPCEAIETLSELAGTDRSYPVVVGAIARSHEVGKLPTMQAFAHAFLSNLVSAAIRLIPLGQTEGQKIIAALMEPSLQAVEKALRTPLEQISNICLMADITSMKHEVQYTRLFRS